MKSKLVMSWSSGKDSALALAALLQSDQYEVVGLMTSVSEHYRRISHHGVRVEMLEGQADAIGLPLHTIMLPGGPDSRCTNATYEQVMEQALRRLQDEGVTHVGFGDLFLQDLREYRERNLARVGMKGVFPLWMRDTGELAQGLIDSGYKAILICVEPTLGERFAGREFDRDLLASLPVGIDPCGENGEFHTFVYDGPIFRRPVPVIRGQTVCRDGRHYTDLVLASQDEMPMICVAGNIPPV